jgi:hypothetical protein
MHTNITRYTFSSALAVLFLLAWTTSQGQNATYVWYSFDGDPYGFAGTIVFNSPSYSGPWDASRIVSITLSTTVSGTYNANLPADLSGWWSEMGWGPTGISGLYIMLTSPSSGLQWSVSSNFPNVPGGTTGLAVRFTPAYYIEDNSGVWMPENVPEPASMWLFLFSVTLGTLHRVSRAGSK